MTVEASERLNPCQTVEHVPYAQPFLRDRRQVADGELMLSQLPGAGIEFDERQCASSPRDGSGMWSVCIAG